MIKPTLGHLARCRIALCVCAVPLATFAADQHDSAQEPELAKNSSQYFAGSEHDADQAKEFWDNVADRKYLFGDWFGVRDDLAANGISVTLSFVTNLAGNPVGGMSRGFTETDSTGLNVAVDFGTLAGLDGLTGFVSTAYRQGTSLAQRRIGSAVSVQQVYGGQTFHLVNLYLAQTLFDNHLHLKAGRIAQFDDFSHDFAFGYYMNNGFDGQPVGFFFQGPFTAYPVTTWGAIAKWGMPLDEDQGVYAFAGVYGADTEVGDNRYHGTDFSFDFNRGANVMVEVGYKRNWGMKAVAEGALATKAAIGGWWFTGDFPVNSLNQNRPATKEGIGGFYYLLHQGLYREKHPVETPPESQLEGGETYWGQTDVLRTVEQGLFVFATGQFAGASTSQFDVFVNFGAYYRGLLPGRDEDVLALGYYHGYFSDELFASQVANNAPPQSYEAALELGYRCNITDYFYVQPNIQYVMNPGGTGRIDDALVLGAQIEVDF
ncbi:MAG: carbohydrate porin [Puniceicoccales bacterium]